MAHALVDLMADKNYEVHIKKVGVFRFPSDYKFESHSHYRIEINYVAAGSCTMVVDGDYINLKKGDCIIIYPNKSHSFMVNVKQSCRLTQLEVEITLPRKSYCFSFLDDIITGVSYRKCYHCDLISSHLELLSQYNKMIDNPESKQSVILFKISEMIVVLSDFIEREKKANDKEKDTFKALLQYIHENFTSEINMEDLAQSFGISSRYVRKRFDTDIGMNSTQYINMLRVNKAKELLCDYSLSATDVAYITGFGSSQYFSRIFKTYTKMTPQEYRRL